MKTLSLAIALGVTMLVVVAATPQKPATGAPAWSMNATAIEACSCPMFCQCYFNSQPAAHGMQGMEGMGHGEDHYCRFNAAYKINKGSYGSTKLDGAKFWLYGDLGGDFTQGKLDWVVVTFDKAATPEQRTAIGAIAGKLFPVQWNSMTTGEGDISWTATKDAATALLDGGKTAEVQLKANATRINKSEPTVIKNLQYWGAARNDGFVLMPNTVEATRTGDKAFEYKGTNGFMITVDMSSKDYAAAKTD